MIHLHTGTTQYFAFEPDWSPDGTRIVFCMYIHGQEDIYTANADGSNLVQVTEHAGIRERPRLGAFRRRALASLPPCPLEDTLPRPARDHLAHATSDCGRALN